MKLKNNPYLLINLIITGIVGLMFIYSGIFSASGLIHPIKSQFNDSVISSGLSRAFSEIVRLNFGAALYYNPYSIHIFLFFFIQFFLRIGYSIMLLSTNISKKLLVYTDVLISVLLFLWAFSKFVFDQFV